MKTTYIIQFNYKDEWRDCRTYEKFNEALRCLSREAEVSAMKWRIIDRKTEDHVIATMKGAL